MTFIIHNYAANIVKEKEVSGDKLVKFLMSDNRLREAIIRNDLSGLLIDMEHSILLLCKQRRGRQTTLEQIRKVMADQSLNQYSKAQRVY
ncbi:MAG: hypothetical protein H0W50_04750 [Parachlamydiaceae bacterium]|nr:hypothetical protein [Parachlamydiaceae bacterium]